MNQYSNLQAHIEPSKRTTHFRSDLHHSQSEKDQTKFLIFFLHDQTSKHDLLTSILQRLQGRRNAMPPRQSQRPYPLRKPKPLWPAGQQLQEIAHWLF